MTIGACADLSRCLGGIAAPLTPNSNRAAIFTHALRTPNNTHTRALTCQRTTTQSDGGGSRSQHPRSHLQGRRRRHRCWLRTRSKNRKDGTRNRRLRYGSLPSVAMSVNDIVTSGAKPLFFLDYFATGHLDVDVAEQVIKGIVEGCKQSDCALLGGETAEMPGLYKEGEYDLSGCAVGIVKKDSVINGKNITAGDILIGLPSSGVHSNGFSLVRRVLAQSGLSLKDQLPGGNVTVAEALMAPTVIYVKQVLDLISKGGVKGIAHITGGGFTDNIPRIFPEGLGATIYKDSWDVLPVFKWLQEAGKIEDSEMRRTFNMGIGMVLVVNPDTADRILGSRSETNKVYRIGEVTNGNGVSFT